MHFFFENQSCSSLSKDLTTRNPSQVPLHCPVDIDIPLRDKLKDYLSLKVAHFPQSQSGAVTKWHGSIWPGSVLKRREPPCHMSQTESPNLQEHMRHYDNFMFGDAVWNVWLRLEGIVLSTCSLLAQCVCLIVILKAVEETLWNQ